VNNVTLITNCVIVSQSGSSTFIKVPEPSFYGSLNFTAMKNALYVIAALILVIWGIIFLGLHSGGSVHFLLAVAFLIILVRLIFSKQLGAR
jgi:hypothetical protein